MSNIESKICWCVLGFDSQVQDSKGKAEEALTTVPMIEKTIRQAQNMTTNAKEALAGAGDHEQNSKKLLESAESISQVDKLNNIIVIHSNENAVFNRLSNYRR